MALTMEDTEEMTFHKLGLSNDLCNACIANGWKFPTPIQEKAIPIALQRKDVVGLAETGSGKTAAFGLPLLQALQKEEYPSTFGLILVPTRELALQIKEHLKTLDKKASCLCLVGGEGLVEQYMKLVDPPSIIVATPGRLVEHLEKSKGFKLDSIKFLIVDEADRMLNMDFEEEVNIIMEALPKARQTMLFSATMTTKLRLLQRIILKKGTEVSISSNTKTVENLEQFMVTARLMVKEAYLVAILTSIGKASSIIFCSSRSNTLLIAIMLRKLGFASVPIYGKMDQTKRYETIQKFKSGTRPILVATDVVSRGIDIEDVEYVINFEVPMQPKDYIHRVGRTARAGKTGISITLVSQYEIEDFVKIEQLTKQEMKEYAVDKSTVKKLQEAVLEAKDFAASEIRRMENKVKSIKESKRKFVDKDKPKKNARRL